MLTATGRHVKFFYLGPGACRKTSICCVALILRHCGVQASTPHGQHGLYYKNDFCHVDGNAAAKVCKVANRKKFAKITFDDDPVVRTHHFCSVHVPVHFKPFLFKVGSHSRSMENQVNPVFLFLDDLD